MTRLRLQTLLGLTFLLATASAFAAPRPDFTSIVKKNSAAVVHVQAKYKGHQGQESHRGRPRLPPGVPDIFRRFFEGPGGSAHGRMPHRAEPSHEAIGSGFIISSDGYVLTNAHVVDDADDVNVRLYDRRVLDAEVVGTDKPYDIALLKVDADDLPTVSLGDSSTLLPGQWVVAIGSPFNFDHTVTKGIVSAVGRSFGGHDQTDVPFIQTDVPINRGNSGGPLFNMDGQVVGINSQIYSSTGGYEGISFSIPINIAMDAVHQLKDKGYVSRGMIGVSIQQVDAAKAKALNMDAASGALIGEVKDDSPAAKAGLEVGDVIQRFDGQEILNASDLPPMAAATDPGTKVKMQILHNGEQKTVTVKMGEKPRDDDSYSSMGSDQKASQSAELGFKVKNLTDDQREALDLKDDQGVVVSEVDGRQAVKAGLRPGFVVLMVGQQTVHDVDQFKELTQDVKPGDSVLLLVHTRQGNSGFVTVTVPDKD